MSNLSAFLAENAAKQEVIKYVASKRFFTMVKNEKTGKEEKKFEEWKIGCVTGEEDERIRKSCIKRVQVPGKKNLFQPETDSNEYMAKLAAKCTLYPDLNDATLQQSYGVMSAEELLRTMLTPGEYQDYLLKVQEANGFNSMDELVDQAKN